MARAFAGFLACLALAICLVRGIVHQADPTAVLKSGLVAFWAFAVIGFLAGAIAERIVRESLATQTEAETGDRSA